MSPELQQKLQEITDEQRLINAKLDLIIDFLAAEEPEAETLDGGSAGAERPPGKDLG